MSAEQTSEEPPVGGIPQTRTAKEGGGGELRNQLGAPPSRRGGEADAWVGLWGRPMPAVAGNAAEARRQIESRRSRNCREKAVMEVGGETPG